VNAELTWQIAQLLYQTSWIADANALVGKVQETMLKLQTTTVLQIIKKTMFSIQNSVDVNAELTWRIAPLLLYQTSSTVDANALVGKVQETML
jgi:hypothetical protein